MVVTWLAVTRSCDTASDVTGVLVTPGGVCLRVPCETHSLITKLVVLPFHSARLVYVCTYTFRYKHFHVMSVETTYYCPVFLLQCVLSTMLCSGSHRVLSHSAVPPPSTPLICPYHICIFGLCNASQNERSGHVLHSGRSPMRGASSHKYTTLHDYIILLYQIRRHTVLNKANLMML